LNPLNRERQLFPELANSSPLVTKSARFSTAFRCAAGMDSACVRKLGIQIPAVIDEFGNSTEQAYTGWPDRLYLIGACYVRLRPIGLQLPDYF
jgi:hypothetical protein